MKRIQRQRMKGWRLPEGAVYVGRPSRWGNPWRVRRGPRNAYRVATAAIAVAWFRERLADLAPIGWYEPLRGHDLACWCPEPCGAEVALYGVPYGDLYEPCAKPRGHEGGHDPSVPAWCHADVLLKLANREPAP